MGALLIAGCAGAPRQASPEPVEALFADALFRPAAEAVDQADPLAVDDAMRAFGQAEVLPLFKTLGRNRGLQRAIQDTLQLDYDMSVTRDAAGTFAARAGNCLSLVLLTAALAREYDIPFEYRTASGHGAWNRTNGLIIYSEHVYLVLRPAASWWPGLRDVPVVVDFVTRATAAAESSRPLAANTIVAMYRNNRAAETLVAGDVDQAYWWARAAVMADPGFVPAQNTLAVVFRQHGRPAEAERALRSALQREPENVQALSNLHALLVRAGRHDDAAAVYRRLATLAPYPPFYFLDRGLAAVARGDYVTASTLLKRELARMPYDDEVNYALGLVELQRGRVGNARRHVLRALENSPTRDRRALYAAKLNRLESMR